jgi:hypothetical protein
VKQTVANGQMVASGSQESSGSGYLVTKVTDPDQATSEIKLGLCSLIIEWYQVGPNVSYTRTKQMTYADSPW